MWPMAVFGAPGRTATDVRGLLGSADREFLLETSIVSCLTDEICGAVATVESMPLRDLQRRCELLEPIDRNGNAYQLPAEFRESLLAELAETEPSEQTNRRHLAAAQVLSKNLRFTRTFSTSPDFDEAINHYFSSRNPRLAADLLAERVTENAQSVSCDDLLRFERPELDDYLPHLLTTATIQGLDSNYAVVEHMLIRLENGDWNGPFPPGLPNLPAALDRLRWLVPGSSTRKLEDSISHTVDHVQDPTSANYLISRYQAAHLSYSLGCRSDAETFIDEILLGHRSLGRQRYLDQEATFLARFLRSMIAHDHGEFEAAQESLQAGETLIAEYQMPEVIAVVMRLIHLTRAIVGNHSSEVRVRLLRRLMSEVTEADLSLQAGLELVCAYDKELDVDNALSTLAELETFCEGRDLAPLLTNRLRALQDALSPQGALSNSLLRLTKRERAVLYLLNDEALTQFEIGEQLGISINTVKSHLRSIHQKFGVTSRSETIEFAANAGLLVTVLPWNRTSVRQRP